MTNYYELYKYDSKEDNPNVKILKQFYSINKNWQQNRNKIIKFTINFEWSNFRKIIMIKSTLESSQIKKRIR